VALSRKSCQAARLCDCPRTGRVCRGVSAGRLLPFIATYSLVESSCHGLPFQDRSSRVSLMCCEPVKKARWVEGFRCRDARMHLAWRGMPYQNPPLPILLNRVSFRRPHELQILLPQIEAGVDVLRQSRTNGRVLQFCHHGHGQLTCCQAIVLLQLQVSHLCSSK